MTAKIQLALVAAALSWLSACAPERARAIREDRSLTLGLPGVSYRPNGSIGLGATIGAGKTDRQRVNTAERGIDALTVKAEGASKVADERVVDSRYTAINPFLHWYPWDDSAFFLGVAAQLYQSRHQYQEETAGSTALAPSYTTVDVARSSTYVGVPVGWAWIWENGISFSLDVGPRFRVGQNASYAQNGEERGVDAAKRERTTETLGSIEPPTIFGGSGIIGYSF